MQWYWVTWETAQFCILTRLKTPLGKPQETFTSIEAVLKSLAGQAQEGLEEDEESKHGRACSLSGASEMFIQFMDFFMTFV